MEWLLSYFLLANEHLVLKRKFGDVKAAELGLSPTNQVFMLTDNALSLAIGSAMVFAAYKGSQALNYSIGWATVMYAALQGVTLHRETVEFGWSVAEKATYINMASIALYFVMLEFTDKAPKRVVKDEKQPGVIVLHLLHWLQVAGGLVFLFRPTLLVANFTYDVAGSSSLSAGTAVMLFFCSLILRAWLYYGSMKELKALYAILSACAAIMAALALQHQSVMELAGVNMALELGTDVATAAVTGYLAYTM